MGRLLRFARLLLLTIFALSAAPVSAWVAAVPAAVHHEYTYDAVPSVATLHECCANAEAVVANALGPTIEDASSWLRGTAGGRGTTHFDLVATKPVVPGATVVDEASLEANTSAKVRGHLFVDKHNLQPLVSKLGSEEAVIKEMLSGVQGSLPKSGFFEIPVQIGGQTVVVRGAVVKGVTRISTAFTP